jgi:UDP-N-acetylglucosamine--N-acetylmuramyl-(pentapeptide) pyrophosphoryl-undecaprenol N-acetylglucosamine transferase
VTDATYAILAGGGTGGHVYPALSLAQELVRRGHSRESVHFVGGRRGPEGRVVPEAGFTIDLLPGRGLQRRLTFQNVGVVFETIVAFWRAFWIVRRRRPHVVVGFGGYASLPCIVAAWFWRVPRVVHEQDSVIGLANRIGVRLGARVAASLPGVEGTDVVVTGNPVREQFRAITRAPVQPPLVAAFGGALGAGSINHAMLDLYDRWRDRADVAVHHVTGPRNVEECAARLDALRRSGDVLAYELVGYEPNMPDVYTRATLAVCRAGAGTVAELTAAGLPAVLVPLPGAPSDHQSRNATTLERAGAAVVVRDDECTGERIDTVVSELIGGPSATPDAPRLEAMSHAARALGRPDAAARLADVVEQQARA